MELYHICGITLQSNVPLPELLPVQQGRPMCIFELCTGQELEFTPTRWFHHWLLPTGEVCLSFAKVESGYVLSFPAWASFTVSPDGKEIRCYPKPHIPLDTIHHLFLDQVLPLALSRQGKLLLHASAVVCPSGVIAFLGMTGMGKSTLASSFASQGFPLVTDDCLLLEARGEQFVAISSYPGLRLWDDVSSTLFGEDSDLVSVAHYSSKKRLRLRNGNLRFCTDPVALKRVYVLSPPEPVSDGRAITIAPLSQREAFLTLVRFAYKLDITDRERLRDEFSCLSRLAALPFFCRLAFPQDFALLPNVREAILHDLNGGEPA